MQLYMCYMNKTAQLLPNQVYIKRFRVWGNNLRQPFNHFNHSRRSS
ncbi:hypothetical protein M33023_04840 [Candidatus Phytoplasma asteris]|uniref:Uncharacterized protein n=1 Tax=Candidatus Phytoplasma asteris TaxID=85620 RepID=A0ABZ2YFG6_9MOLU